VHHSGKWDASSTVFLTTRFCVLYSGGKRLSIPVCGSNREHPGRHAIFTAFQQILSAYKNDLAVRTEKPGNCSLETRTAGLNGRLAPGAAHVTSSKPEPYSYPKH
jgi:hypothetical protein